MIEKNFLLSGIISLIVSLLCLLHLIYEIKKHKEEDSLIIKVQAAVGFVASLLLSIVCFYEYFY